MKDIFYDYKDLIVATTVFVVAMNFCMGSVLAFMWIGRHIGL